MSVLFRIVAALLITVPAFLVLVIVFALAHSRKSAKRARAHRACSCRFSSSWQRSAHLQIRLPVVELEAGGTSELPASRLDLAFEGERSTAPSCLRRTWPDVARCEDTQHAQWWLL